MQALPTKAILTGVSEWLTDHGLHNDVRSVPGHSGLIVVTARILCSRGLTASITIEGASLLVNIAGFQVSDGVMWRYKEIALADPKAFEQLVMVLNDPTGPW